MLDKFFYTIYNYYYSNGNYKKGQTPGLSVFLILGIVLFFVLLATYAILTTIIYGSGNTTTPSRLSFCGAAFFSYTVIYFRFFFNKKSYRIYEMYKEDKFLNSKKATRICFACLFFAFFIYFMGTSAIINYYNKQASEVKKLNKQ